MPATYVVVPARQRPVSGAAWDDPPWNGAASLDILHFHPQSSPHRPATRVKMVYSTTALYGIFHVRDRYVRCVHTKYQSAVYRDACVELFVQPRPDKGYMNFEMNCCGHLLLRYIEDPTRLPDGAFARQVAVPEHLGRLVQMSSSLSGPVIEEIDRPIEWTLAFQIPLRLVEAYVGPLGGLSGQIWRANLHKCAEDNSHPHWATWAPIGERLDFHQPDKFGTLRFR